MSSNGHRYNVGGVMLERPFKSRRLGHFGFNVHKVEESREFYGDILGFTQSDKADFSRAPWFPKDQDLGPQGYFMRYGTDHHAMVLFSKKVMDMRADRKFAPGADPGRNLRCRRRESGAGVQDHHLSPGIRKFMGDLYAFEETVFEEDILKELSEFWNVPLSVSQFIYGPVSGIFRFDL